VMVRRAYDGLIAASALWHSSGVNGSRMLDTPVGTPLMIILDHLTLALGGGMVVWEGSWNLLERMLLMCNAASWRDAGVAEGPPVTTRLPFAVHLTAASWTCGGEMALSCSLRTQQTDSSDGQVLDVNSKLARLTTRLGLGGLDPATAE